MPRPAPRAPAFGGTWATLTPPLTPWISDVIAAQGFERMTPVQAGTIPRAIKNQDCVVEAVTGSGKTLAFVVPVLERIVRSEHKYKKGEVAAVVIAPTRELASQIYDVFNLFLSSLTPPTPSPVDGEEAPPPPPPEHPLPVLITSGTKQPYETFFNQNSNIIIGTPGRLASFLLSPRGQNAVRVSNLDALILDEADRLLSAPDHRRDVERIMRHLPKQRRTHLFSATMTDAVEDLVGVGLRNPVRIVVNLKDKRAGEVSERRVPMGLQNTYLVCGQADKTLQLIRVLQQEAREHEAAKMIVYFSTGAAVDYFYRILPRLPEMKNFHLTSLHGDLPPRVREQALTSFTSHSSSHLAPAVLFCTDLASRGVDFADIDAVIQYDPPTDPKTFSHRVGRTARAGRSGRAILLLSRGREEQYIDFLAVRKIPLARQPYIGSEGVAEPSIPADADSLTLLERMRDIAKTDRDFADRGAKAMVSAVRAFTKHEASFIFRPTDIDYAAMGTAFGLLRLPAMPEIKDWRRRCEKAEKKAIEAKNAKEAPQQEVVPPVAGTSVAEEVEEKEQEEYIPRVGWTDAEMDYINFPYADKKREATRLASVEEKKAEVEELKAQREKDRAKRKVAAEMRSAWSVQKERKVRREERAEKKDNKKRAQWEAKKAAGEEVDEPELRRKRKKVEEEKKEEEGDYKALKKELGEESKARKAQKKEVAAGMFDDLD